MEKQKEKRHFRCEFKPQDKTRGSREGPMDKD